MTPKRFFLWLVILTVPLLVLSYILSTVSGFEHTKSITALSIPFFVLLSISIFFLGLKAAKSKDKNSLTRLVMATVFIKLVGCLAVIIIHDRLYHPDSGHYALPFIIYYIVYTSFEVKVLMDINKTTKLHGTIKAN